MEITAESLRSAYPDVIGNIERAAFHKGFAEGRTTGTDEGLRTGAQKERDRIKAVEGTLLPGHEGLVAQMKYDGATTGEQAAMKILQAEKTLRETKLDLYRTDGPPAAAAPDPARNEPVKADTPVAGETPTEDQMKATWNKDKSLRAEFANDFDAYKAYTEAQAEGRVRIYGAKGGN